MRKGIVLFFLCSLLVFPIYGQPTDINKIQCNIDEAERLRSLGKFNNSIDTLNKIDQADKETYPKIFFNIYNQLGILYWNIGSLNDSLKYFKNSLELAKKYRFIGEISQANQSITIIESYKKAKILRENYKYDESLKLFQETVDIAKKLNNVEFELKCTRQMSLVYYDLAEFDIFYKFNERSLSIARHINHKKDIGICLNNIGLFFWKVDNYSAALKYYGEALPIANEINIPQFISEVLNNMGLIYKDVGNYDKALFYFKEAQNIDQKSNNLDYLIIDMNNIGTTFRKRGLVSNDINDFSRALEYFFKCLDLISLAKDQRIRLLIYNNIGTTFADLGNFSEAQNYFKIGLKYCEDFNDIEAKSNLLNNLGITSFNLKNFDDAKFYLHQSIEIASKLKGGKILWEAYFELGNLMKNGNDYLNALNSYKNSISIIEKTRNTIDNDDLRSTYFGSDKRIDVYNSLIDLLFKTAKTNENDNNHLQAFNIIEREKARTFLDILSGSRINQRYENNSRVSIEIKQLENEVTNSYKKLLLLELTSQQKNIESDKLNKLEDELEILKSNLRLSNPSYANLQYPEIIELKKAQKFLLNEDTLCIEFTIGKESAYAFSMTKEKINIYKIPNENVLKTKVKQFLSILADKSCRDFSIGEELYRELIRPALNANFRNLIIIPDNVLYYLPFEALPIDAKGGKWLIEKCAILYTPSLSSYNAIKKNEYLKKRNMKDLIAFSNSFDPSPNASNSQIILKELFPLTGTRMEPLKYANLEIDRILSHIHSKDIFKDTFSTAQNLGKSELDDYKIIHFATHVLINDIKPLRSAIILSTNIKAEEDGFIQVNEIMEMKIAADLVVLSACQTGLGRLLRGEGIEGLNRAFFYAGASSVLMTLWSINDQASAQLMDRFYYHLGHSASIMKALQRAKLDMIESPYYSHPYYWAGYILSGDGFRVIFPRTGQIWIWLGIGVGISASLAAILRLRRRKRTETA